MIDPIKNPTEFNEKHYAVERVTRQMYNSILSQLLIAIGIIAVLGIIVGWLIAGAAGIYGALLAIGLAVLFIVTTVIVMRATASQPLVVVSAVSVGSWIVKVVITFGIMLAVRDSEFYHRAVFLFTLIPVIIASSAIEMRAVARARIPYLDLGAGNAPTKPSASDHNGDQVVK